MRPHVRPVLLAVVSLTALLLPSGTYAQPPATPSLQQTRDVVTEFLSAYDMRQTRVVLSLVTRNIRYADCDYARGLPLVMKGKQAFKRWLRKQFTLHDQFAVSLVQPWGYTNTTDGATPLVFGFDGTRSNDALRALGFQSVKLYFPKGRMNDTGTKIASVTIAGAGCSPTG